MKLNKKTIKVIIISAKAYGLFCIVLGLIMIIKELIIGITFGEPMPYNLLAGFAFFLGGLAVLTSMIMTEQDIEIKELKRKLRNNE